MKQQVLNSREMSIFENITKSGIENMMEYSTQLGVLYKGDLLDLLPNICSASIDTVFADPPFNLSKVYGAKVTGLCCDGYCI